MPKTEAEKIVITLTAEKLDKLRKAKEHFENDTKRSINMADFLDMLVEAYLTYRDSRGAAESNLLQNLKHSSSSN